MDTEWEDTESRCPPTVHCDLPYRSHQFCLSLLLQGQRPLEHREGGGLGLPATASWLDRLHGHELGPGEQRLLRLRGLASW